MLVWLGRCGQPGRTGDILSLSDIEVKVHRASERSLRSGVQVRIAGRDEHAGAADTYSSY
jgi:hypothetical protein